MQTKIESVDFIQSPLYWGKDYDGFDVDLYDLNVVVTLPSGKKYTHQRRFNANESMIVEEFVDVVRFKGYVDLTHWWEGTTWDRYNTPQSYEEEKEQALEFERDNPTTGW